MDRPPHPQEHLPASPPSSPPAPPSPSGPFSFPPDPLPQARRLLAERFGHRDFLPGQEAALASVFAGRNLLAVMPTGSGKSLLFQLPALMQDGLTVVVSPLISLMKDQVDDLTQRKLPATFVNSSLAFEEQMARLSACRRGEVRLLYLAPERFRSESFLARLPGLRVFRLAVDEAHCISEWGHDFRPDYRRIRQFRERMGRPPLTALTATATRRVQADIVESLGLSPPEVDLHVHGFDRPNLAPRVIRTVQEEDKLLFLEALVQEQAGPAIIFTGTRRTAEAVGRHLRQQEPRTTVYHAGMEARARITAQEAFLSGASRLVVATSAFGMGIDKPDVRLVAHYQYPASVEQYYQEIGRAGRDGLPSVCALLHAYSDRFLRQFFIDMNYPGPGVVKAVYETLWRTADNPLRATYRQIAGRCTGDVKDGQVGTALRLLWQASLVKPGDGYPRAPESGRVLGIELSAPDRARVIVKLAAVPPPFKEVPIDWGLQSRLRRAEEEKLRAMEGYLSHTGCRRGYILHYFGEREGFRCGVCDLCRKPPTGPAGAGRWAIPGSTEKGAGGILDRRPGTALAILWGVRHLRFPLGKNRLAQVLSGSRDKKLLAWQVDRNPAFGLLRASGASLSFVIDDLIREGYLEQQGEPGRPVLGLTALGRLHASPLHPETVRDALEREMAADRGEDADLGKGVPGAEGRSGRGDRPESALRRPLTAPDNGGAVPGNEEIEQAALSVVAGLGKPVGITKVAAVLNGSRAAWIDTLGADRLKAYGAAGGMSQVRLQRILRSMLVRGLFRRGGYSPYQVLLLTEAGRERMKTGNGGNQR